MLVSGHEGLEGISNEVPRAEPFVSSSSLCVAPNSFTEYNGVGDDVYK
ncbi:MAG: hypothetical protein WCJ54_04470 [Actinomycetota bacterium]